MFESDYPHSDSNWPHAREMLAKSLADMPDAVASKIAEENARRVYNFPRG
jgi:predicted TIM-barrel fold metal-dependent hydrolase